MNNRYHKPYDKKLKTFARQNRSLPTKAEQVLWNYVLRRDKLGYRWLRQKPIDNFILDFYCDKLLLGIELDGESHEGKEEYDNYRTIVLESVGIKLIRFWNHELTGNIELIKEKLLKEFEIRKQEIGSKSSPTPPLIKEGINY
ncbi:MAG: endonuclease domain-containing protein [Candidatus Dojkabacteria bacterium]